MIKLQLKDGRVIESESKDARMIECTCTNVWCNSCPFGTHCEIEFRDMSFGEAMEQRKEKIDELVEEIIECDNKVKEHEESKKKYTFELTDEQAMYLHAFMNRWETDGIKDTLDVVGFFDKDTPPFVNCDYKRVPKEWYEDNSYHIVNIMHAISYEIYNKLSEQREFDE